MTRILCIGADESLLRTRCAVLAQNGYDAVCSLFSGAEGIILGTKRFDLIVVSAFLSDQEKAEVLAIVAGKTPTIVLEGLTLATELLTLVEGRLAQASITENFCHTEASDGLAH
jgi:hypothetical protein